jgi:hypothetical protein
MSICFYAVMDSMKRYSRTVSRRRHLHQQILLENLESRLLLNGLTIITHGYEPFSNARPSWIDSMGNAIANQAGPGTSVYTLRLEPTNGSTVHVSRFARLSGPDQAGSSNGEIILLLDWAAVSGIVSQSYSASYLASVVTPYLEEPFPSMGLTAPMAQGSIQMIGHSRGASFISEIAKDLGQAGIWVDQLTTLDPVPGPSDPAVKLGANIVFADNYYQHSGDGFLVPNGSRIAGAANLGALSLGGAYSILDGSTHNDVHLFYFGTIKTTGSPGDGSASVKTSWYSANHVDRTATGFYYSRIEGGTRPAGGLASAFGGNASRSAVARSGAQWSNIGYLAPSLTTVAPGESFDVSFLYQDADSAANVQWYFDVDQNPYNNNSLALGDAAALAKTGNTVADANGTLAFTGDTGTYYLEGRIGDGQSQRYAYAASPITVSIPPESLAFSQGPASLIAGADLPITVEIHDSLGHIINTDNSMVTLSLVGTAGGSLAGNHTVQAVNGVATFPGLSITRAGAYTLTATDADGSIIPITSGSFTVSPDTSTAQLHLVQQPAPALVGSPLSPIVVSIQDQYGNLLASDHSQVALAIASGPDGATLTGNSAISFANGAATFSTIQLSTAGAYTLSLTDGALAPLQFSQEVAQAITSIKPSRVSRAYSFGKPIRISAAFKSTGPASLAFTGSAVLLDQAENVLATVSFDNKPTLNFSLDNLAPGDYTCTISYPGDANHSSAATSPFTFRVTPAKSFSKLSLSEKTVFYGEPVILTASLASGVVPHTGTITFKSGNTVLGIVNLLDDSASFPLPMPMVGAHNFSASYSGDDHYRPDNSGKQTLNVARDQTQALLTTTALGPVSAGQQFTLSVALFSLVVGSPIPTGTVTLKDGKKTLGTVALDPTGVATFTTSLSGISTHHLTARYSGDDLMSSTTSPTLLQVVTA